MPDTRTLTDRVAAIQRGGPPITPQQRYDATALLGDLLAAAERHGVTLANFDGIVDLPGGCLDAVLARSVRA
jgi:hypothetical protein